MDNDAESLQCHWRRRSISTSRSLVHAAIRLAFFLFVWCPPWCCLGFDQRRTVNILILAPKDNKYWFSTQRVLPGLEMALDKVHDDPTLLRGRKLVLHIRDTQCNEAIGMNDAIQAVWDGKVDAIVGLVCEYVLAPIIRQAKYWNLPLITPGANAWDFVVRRKTLYPMLTKVGPPNNPDVAQMFKRLMAVYRWHKIKLIYDKRGLDYVNKDTCHFLMEVLIIHLNNTDHVKIDQYNDMQTLVKQEIGLEYSERL